MEILKIENVRYSYDRVNPALNGVSISLESGKYYSIIGHNGSGKSTLAKIIMGLIEPSKGKVTVFDKEMNEQNVGFIRQKLGIVFQNPDNQFIGSTVRDDIAFGLENKCVPNEDMEGIILEYASKVNMLDYLNHEPSNLSGGQKQRVAIAGVLAMTPELIILDEATSMLDPKGRREIKEVLSSLRQNNPELTIISITHDIDEACLSAYVVVLNAGQVFLKGTPDEVFVDENKLESINVQMPFTYRLHKALKENGVDIKSNKSLEEMVDELCR